MKIATAGWALGIAVVLLATTCGDDGASGSGTTTGGESTSTRGSAEGADETATADGPSGCVTDLDCDDGDPCTADTCGGGTCSHELVVNNECRPQIDVSFPARAETVQGTSGRPTVTVVGNVRSGVADITSLTVNGTEVSFDAEGNFNHDVEATTGGNLLVLQTADSMGNTRRRVQTFNWSTAYDLPTKAPAGISPIGLGFYLAQASIDDGDPKAPINDLASILRLVLEGFDVGALFDANTVIASEAGYDIYLTGLTIGDTTLSLTAIDGGIQLDATLSAIEGDLDFDCTNVGCLLAGGDSSGGLSISTVQLTAELDMNALPDHTLAAELDNVSLSVDPDDVSVWSNNIWTDILLSVVELFVLDGLVSDLESQLETTVTDELGPALAGGFSQLTLATSFEFPNLGNARMPIVVDLFADFEATDFHDGAEPPAPSPPQGGLVTLRGGGYAMSPESPHENLGVPRRNECGTGDTTLRMPRAAPLEIGLTDDLLNQLLYAGWRGGLLEFPLDSKALGGAGGGLVSDFNVVVSGHAAPTASDCADDGALRVMLGDIQIDAELMLLGDPVTFTAYTTIIARMDISETEDGVALNFDEVELVDTELTADDMSIEVEELLQGALEAELVGGLLDQLGGLGEISLPPIDLSGALGLPAGSAPLDIGVQAVSRAPGNTVISAQLQ